MSIEELLQYLEDCVDKELDCSCLTPADVRTLLDYIRSLEQWCAKDERE